MEAKKNINAQLEHRRKYYFQLGIVLGLSLSLVAFEWTQFDDFDYHKTVTTDDSWDIDDVMIPVTVQNPPKVPELPEPQPKGQILNPVKDPILVDPQITVVDPSSFPDVTLVGLNFDDDEDRVVDVELDVVVDWASQLPEYVGGEQALKRYLKTHLKYPPLAVDVGASGTVYIKMVISKKGEVTQIGVIRDEVGFGCAEVALRVIKSMPKWKPGMQGTVPVNVQMSIPVHFVLQ
jgi:protein TonB